MKHMTPSVHHVVVCKQRVARASWHIQSVTLKMARSSFVRFVLLVLARTCYCIPPHDEVARVARFIVHNSDWASMATIASRDPIIGTPFANVFSVSDGPLDNSTGELYMYLTALEISVQDLQVNPSASLVMSLAQTSYCMKEKYDPQSPLCAHVIFSGTIVKVNDTEADFAKEALFSRHPEMIQWPSDHNWFFAKLNITNVYVLDYFGGVKTVTPIEYYKAKP